MRQELRDTAFTMRIHMGMTRSGKAFLESDIVENVLGDVQHRECMSVAMELARKILESFLNEHFGAAKETVTAEQLKQEVDDFFDREVDIDG